MNSVTVLVCVHSPGARWDEYLSRALASLRAQTTAAFDTVVVLDECHPGTHQIAVRDSPRGTRVLEKPTPKNGLAAAKNYGLQAITTDWVAFLDADDWYLPGKLQQQLEWCKQKTPDTRWYAPWR